MQVKPELLSRIQDFLQGSRADKTALAALHRDAFGYPLNEKCGLCINDSIKALQGLVNIKTKPEKQKTMGQFTWTTNKKYEKATVIIRPSGGGGKVVVHKGNLTDETAAIIAGIPKYAHLVVEVAKTEPTGEYISGVVKEETEPVGNVEQASNGSEESQADTSTSKEQPSEEAPVKKKKGKQK